MARNCFAIAPIDIDRVTLIQYFKLTAASRNLFAYRATGLTAVQVVPAATLKDARLFGMEGRLKMIKAGAMADVIALEGDPEQDSWRPSSCGL